MHNYRKRQSKTFLLLSDCNARTKHYKQRKTHLVQRIYYNVLYQELLSYVTIISLTVLPVAINNAQGESTVPRKLCFMKGIQANERISHESKLVTLTRGETGILTSKRLTGTQTPTKAHPNIRTRPDTLLRTLDSRVRAAQCLPGEQGKN